MLIKKTPYTLFEDTCTCCGSVVEYEQNDVKSGEWWCCPVCLYDNEHSSKNGKFDSRPFNPYWKDRTTNQIRAEMRKQKSGVKSDA